MDDNKIIDLYRKRSKSAIEETDKKYGRYCKTNAMGTKADFLAFVPIFGGKRSGDVTKLSFCAGSFRGDHMTMSYDHSKNYPEKVFFRWYLLR